MDANETHRTKARCELHNNATCKLEPILEATHHKKDIFLPSNKSSRLKEQDLRVRGGDVRTNRNMNTPVLAGQQRLTLISPLQTLDAVKKTLQERLKIGKGDERESGKSFFYQYELIVNMQNQRISIVKIGLFLFKNGFKKRLILQLYFCVYRSIGANPFVLILL